MTCFYSRPTYPAARPIVVFSNISLVTCAKKPGILWRSVTQNSRASSSPRASAPLICIVPKCPSWDVNLSASPMRPLGAYMDARRMSCPFSSNLIRHPSSEYTASRISRDLTPKICCQLLLALQKETATHLLQAHEALRVRGLELGLLLHEALVALQRDSLTAAREPLEQRCVLGPQLLELLRAHGARLCGRVGAELQTALALRVELAGRDTRHQLGHLGVQRLIRAVQLLDRPVQRFDVWTSAEEQEC